MNFSKGTFSVILTKNKENGRHVEPNSKRLHNVFNVTIAFTVLFSTLNNMWVAKNKYCSWSGTHHKRRRYYPYNCCLRFFVAQLININWCLLVYIPWNVFHKPTKLHSTWKMYNYVHKQQKNTWRKTKEISKKNNWLFPTFYLN